MLEVTTKTVQGEERRAVRWGPDGTSYVCAPGGDCTEASRKALDWARDNGVPESEIERAGLSQVGSLEFGASYSETLRRWHAAFNAAWAEIQLLGFDERFRRMWNLYLTSCAASFSTGTTDVAQVTMRRPL